MHGNLPRRLPSIPPAMPRAFHLDGLIDGEWHTLQTVADNHQRLVRLSLETRLQGMRFVVDESWGAVESRVYAFYLD